MISVVIDMNKKTSDFTNLTPMRRKVMLEKGTEPPFKNEYWDHFEEGIYVDPITGIPLFSSNDKFFSDCGWPSFAKPITKSAIATETDLSFAMARTEVHAEESRGHLGHVFDDGPPDKGGLRYCINSAALRFIPRAEMEKAGYGEYLPLFEEG